MTTMNEERAGYMPIPTVEQLADALANVRCFHDLSAELIAPELLKNLLAAAPAQPAVQGNGDQQEALHVWRATTRFGETCHFGEASTARAWAGENGTVERIELTTVPELRVVERQEQGEVQRLREALEHCSEVMKDPWKHGEGCISRAIYMADAALAAGTGQEVE